jgi:hypothetical protein
MMPSPMMPTIFSIVLPFRAAPTRAAELAGLCELPSRSTHTSCGPPW